MPSHLVREISDEIFFLFYILFIGQGIELFEKSRVLTELTDEIIHLYTFSYNL